MYKVLQQVYLSTLHITKVGNKLEEKKGIKFD